MDFMDKKALLGKLKQKRVSLGLSQDEVAKALGVNDSQYSKLERGDSDLTLPNLLSLMKRLDLTFVDLAEGDSLPQQSDSITLKALIETMNANNSTLIQAIKGNEKKFSSAGELLLEKLEALPNAEKLIQNMAFLVQRQPDLFIKQYSFDFDLLQSSPLSTEAAKQGQSHTGDQPGKHQKTKRSS